MKTKVLVYALFTFLLFQACNRKAAADFNSDFSLFKEHITNFSGGIVSAHSDIRVVLAVDKKEWKANQVLDSDLFDISPSVDGKVVALSNNTLAFVPEEKLEQNTEYQVTLHLDQLMEVKEELKDFNFTLKTIRQDFMVETLDIQSYSPGYQYLNGVLKTADKIDFETAQKLVSAQQKDQSVKVKFFKAPAMGTEFKFLIDSIQQFSEESNLEIRYDGEDFDIEQKGTIDYKVAAKNNFKIVKIDIPEGNNQTMLVNFSEPLRSGQDFSGLIAIQNTSNLKFATQGNLLKVFFTNDLPESNAKVAVASAEPVEEAAVEFSRQYGNRSRYSSCI